MGSKRLETVCACISVCLCMRRKEGSGVGTDTDKRKERGKEVKRGFVVGGVSRRMVPPGNGSGLTPAPTTAHVKWSADTTWRTGDHFQIWNHIMIYSLFYNPVFWYTCVFLSETNPSWSLPIPSILDLRYF